MMQTVLVTGASSGIGKATALLLQREGFTVFGTTRRPDAVGAHAFPMLALDVRSDASVKECFDALFAKVDHLDVLIDNAGYALTGAAEETTLAEAKAQFETNFFGAVRVVNAALPAMRAARAGKIIIIGSLAGLTAIPFGAFYSATKFALEGYAEALWHELRPFGISVTLVEPGFVRTHLGEASQVAAGPLPVYAAAEKRVLRTIGDAVSRGIAPERVAERVLGIVRSDQPRLRYRVGADATWLPRLKHVAPWPVFAAGVRRTFGLGGSRG
jgi:NAD(P)-dependent dehydrogenase (short-subunit alcohol dehydrogenase family)